MSQNFRLFHVSNLSVRNFRIFLLMYTGSITAPVADVRIISADCLALSPVCRSHRRAPSAGRAPGPAVGRPVVPFVVIFRSAVRSAPVDRPQRGEAAGGGRPAGGFHRRSVPCGRAPGEHGAPRAAGGTMPPSRRPLPRHQAVKCRFCRRPPVAARPSMAPTWPGLNRF